MNKQGIIDAIASIGEISKKNAATQLENVMSAFKKGLIEDGKVQLVGEITFEIKPTKEQSGEMTMKDGTKKPWTKPAGKTVKAKVADKFIEQVVGK